MKPDQQVSRREFIASTSALKQTKLLMERYRQFYPHKYVQPCSSGTAALHMKVKCPETEAILKTCILFRVNEAMDEDYIRLVAHAVRKVAAHYTA